MSILHVDDSQIPIYTEAGDLTGWATEERDRDEIEAEIEKELEDED